MKLVSPKGSKIPEDPLDTLGSMLGGKSHSIV